MAPTFRKLAPVPDFNFLPQPHPQQFLSTMESIQFIVSRLNQAPFSKNLRLVDFDELSTNDLLQLVNECFEKMDGDMKGDVRDEEVSLMAISRSRNIFRTLFSSFSLLSVPLPK